MNQILKLRINSLEYILGHEIKWEGIKAFVEKKRSNL